MECKIKKMIVAPIRGLALMSVAMTLGCAQPEGPLFTPLEKPLVWPQPPELPRIAYVGMISTEEDLKPAKSWSQGMTELFFGKEDIGVLVSPTGVVFDDQKIYVTDNAAAAVHIFDLNSRDYKQVMSCGDDAVFMMPVAIAFMDESFCVVDSVLRKVCVFDREGDFKFAFGQSHLTRPTGVAFSAVHRQLYVSDTAEHKIKVFGENGEFLYELGLRGIGPGEFNFPTHLWTDEQGNVYVSDTLNYRIQVFSGEGTYLRMFGVHGDRPGNFAHPAGIATDSQGHIYVVDKQYENIQVFDIEGNILMAFGGEGSAPGDFWLPSGIFIGEKNRIYIADSFNKRIQVFEFLETEDD